MTSSKRNFLLEMIEGPRTYCPPANTMILELVDQKQTKGGLLLPENHQQGTEGMKPLGKVLFVAEGRDTWKDEEPPASKGDYVLFSPEMYPIIDIHDGMVVIHFDTVMLRIVEGANIDHPCGIFHVPSEEEPLYKEDVPPLELVTE